MTRSGEDAAMEQAIIDAASGDEDAWRCVVNHFSPRVFALLRSNCNDWELAEEITQSTFCTIAAKLSTYQETGRFQAWIFNIAMNRLRDEMRRRKRHAVNVENETLSGMASGASLSAAEDEASLPGEIGALREAMARLSEADREVIYLRHCTGLSFPDIAEVLEQPLGTVLARHHRAKSRLASHMTERLEDEA